MRTTGWVVDTAEYVAETLNGRGIRAGVASINLYRPFPSHELREAVKGCKAVCVVEYNNWSGHGGRRGYGGRR